MSGTNPKSLDLLGIKPVSKAVEKVTAGVVDGARSFLGRICLPAAEELGLLLKDEVTSWRSQRAIDLARKAEKKVKLFHGKKNVTVHPRIAHAAIEEGSWASDEIVHDMWSGLLASGCTEQGDDDSNIVFIGLLTNLTSVQIRILRYGVEASEKFVTEADWVHARALSIELEELTRISGSNDIHRLDRELDNLRALDLIGGNNILNSGGFDANSRTADITPTPFALHLYLRGEGFPGSPIEYWGLGTKQDLPKASKKAAAKKIAKKASKAKPRSNPSGT